MPYDNAGGKSGGGGGAAGGNTPPLRTPQLSNGTPPKKSEDRRASVLGKRVALAQRALNRKLREGEAYKRFLFGEAPKSAMDVDDPALGVGADNDAEAEAIGKGWFQTTVPAHGMLYSVLAPALLARRPTYINRARKAAPEDERARGKIYAELAKIVERESRVHDAMGYALRDCVQYSVGWLMTEFDPERRLPIVRYVPASRVLVDQETDGRGDVRSLRWVAEKRSIPIEDARYLAKNEWGAKNYEFEPVKNTWDDDDSDQDEFATDDDGGASCPTEFAKLVFVYVKGNNPNTRNARVKGAAVTERPTGDSGYTGRDECVILEAVSSRGSSGSDGYRFVASIPWQFPTDQDEFPLTPLRLTIADTGFYGPSILQVGHNLQVMLNWTLTWYNTDAYLSSRRVISYNKDAFESDKAVKAAFDSPDNLVVIPGKRTLTPADVNVVDFGKPSPTLQEAYAGNLTQYRSVTGLDAFDMEARSHRTATDAAIQNEGAQLRIGSLADQVENTYRSVMRKALQCARRHMTAPEVASWIGEGLMQFEQIATEVDPLTGAATQSTNLTPLWDDRNNTPEAIRKEVDVDIEPRSVRFVSPEQEVNDIQLLIAKQLELSKVVQEAVAAQMVDFARGLAKSGNAALMAMAERLHLPNAEEILLDLNSLIPPPPEPSPASFPPNLAGPSRSRTVTTKPDGSRIERLDEAGGEIPPQAIAEMAQMMEQGTVGPGAFPPELGAAAAQMMG